VRSVAWGVRCTCWALALLAKPAEREGEKEERSAKMICVTVEVCEGAITRRAQLTTSSIEQALKLAGEGKPDRRVRLVFPIDPEAFFVPGDPALRPAT
jgi:hypothetical protein